MSKTITLVPIYGRDYHSVKAVEIDFNADKDFEISDISSRWDGSATNKADLKRDGITDVRIRYHKLRRVHNMVIR